jgi:hypothetical protein
MLVVNAPKVTSTKTQAAASAEKAANPGWYPGLRVGWVSVDMVSGNGVWKVTGCAHLWL